MFTESDPRMKLHDGIADVLRKSGSAMAYREIANALNTSKSYRKRDRSLISENQIRARVTKRRYAQLFRRENGRVTLCALPEPV